MTELPFDELLEEAKAIQLKAYAPYSNYRVGAAALVDDGRIVTGCNVENAGYGVTLCAECGLISELAKTGGGKLVAFVCVGSKIGSEPEVVSPCGRCRQILFEFGGNDLMMWMPSGKMPMRQCLPDGFGPADLEK